MMAFVSILQLGLFIISCSISKTGQRSAIGSQVWEDRMVTAIVAFYVTSCRFSKGDGSKVLKNKKKAFAVIEHRTIPYLTYQSTRFSSPCAAL